MKKKVGFILLVIASAFVWWQAIVWVLSVKDIPAPDVSDLVYDRPVVAPEDNAYENLLELENGIDLSDPEYKAVRNLVDEDSCDLNMVRAIVKKNREILVAVDVEVKKGGYLRPLLTGVEFETPHYSSQFKLVYIMACRGRLQKYDGHYDDAVNSILSLVSYVSFVLQSADSMSDYIVSELLVEVVCSELNSLVLDKRLSVVHLDMLLKEVAKLGDQGEVFANAIKREYSTMDRVVSNLPVQSKAVLEKHLDIKIPFELKEKTPKYLFQVNKTKQRFAEYFRLISENSYCTYNQINLEQLDFKEDENSSFLSAITHPNIIGEILFLGVRRKGIKPLERKCLCECMIISSRLTLALKKFEKCNGHLPQTLKQLIPEYIDAIPRDPFDGKPFRYNKEIGVVYSVGKNLKDDGASHECNEGNTSTCKCRHYLKKKDIVFSVDDDSEPPEQDGY